MEEKRKSERLKDENEIAVTIINNQGNLFKETKFNSHSIDISAFGAKIQSNIFLPVDTLILTKMTLKTLDYMMTTIGKVVWTKEIFEDKSYEVGVELYNPSTRLADYILRKQTSQALGPI